MGIAGVPVTGGIVQDRVSGLERKGGHDECDYAPGNAWKVSPLFGLMANDHAP